MTDSITKLKRRIISILAKAESTNHPEEAASLGAKAKAMMEEHQLSMKDLDQSKDPMGRTSIICPGTSSSFISLATGAGYYFGCAALYSTNMDPVRNKKVIYITFVGRESARVTAELMLPFWIRQCQRLGRKAHKERGFSSNPNKAGRDLMVGLAKVLFDESPQMLPTMVLDEVKGVSKGNRGGQSATQEAVDLAHEIPRNLQVG